MNNLINGGLISPTLVPRLRCSPVLISIVVTAEIASKPLARCSKRTNDGPTVADRTLNTKKPSAHGEVVNVSYRSESSDPRIAGHSSVLSCFGGGGLDSSCVHLANKL